MGHKVINHNLHHDQEPLETLPLTHFPIFQDHQNPPDAGDFFEFFRGGLSNHSDEKLMSHAEDIISCGKLVPINEQLIPPKNPPQQTEKTRRRNQQNHPLGCRRCRSQSRSDVNSRSLDYKKLKRSSSMRSEQAAAIGGSGKKLSPSRWHVLLFGLVNVPPPDMGIRDLKNRQFRLSNTSKTSSVAFSESIDVLPISRSFDHWKCSWRVLDFLSCKSAGNAAVMTPALSYMAKA